MTDELYYNRTNPLVVYVDPSLGLVYHPVVVFIQRPHTLGVCLTPVPGTYQYLKKKIVNASAAVRSNCEFIKYNWKGHLCLFTFFCFNTHILSSCYLEV